MKWRVFLQSKMYIKNWTLCWYQLKIKEGKPRGFPLSFIVISVSLKSVSSVLLYGRGGYSMTLHIFICPKISAQYIEKYVLRAEKFFRFFLSCICVLIRLFLWCCRTAPISLFKFPRTPWKSAEIMLYLSKCFDLRAKNRIFLIKSVRKAAMSND